MVSVSPVRLSQFMPPPAAQFLRIDQNVRGPFGPELLAELARSGVITAATEASANAAGPWTPIGTLGDFAAIFPSRPEVQFKGIGIVRLG